MPVVIIFDSSTSMKNHFQDNISFLQLNQAILKEFLQTLGFISPNEQVSLLNISKGFQYQLSGFNKPNIDLYFSWMENLQPSLVVFDIYALLDCLPNKFQLEWPSSIVPMDIVVFTRGGITRGIVNPVLREVHRRGRQMWLDKRCSKFTLCTLEAQISDDLHELLRAQGPFSSHHPADLSTLRDALSSSPGDKTTLSNWAHHVAMKLILGSETPSLPLSQRLFPTTFSSMELQSSDNSKISSLKNISGDDVKVVLNTSSSCITMVVCRISCAGSITCRSYVIPSPPILLNNQIKSDTDLGNTLPCSFIDSSIRNNELTLDIVGFLNHNDVKAPSMSSRHSLWPVLFDEPEHTCSFTSSTQKVRDNSNFLFLLRSTLLSSPSLVALCSIDFISQSSTINSESTLANQPKWWGFLAASGALTSSTKAAGNTIVLTLLPAGATMVPWLGKLAYLAPISLFDESPYLDEKRLTPFPVCSSIRMSYTPSNSNPISVNGNDDLCNIKRSWTSHTTWSNIANAANEVTRFVRMCRKINESNVPALYKELNRIRVAACLYGFTEVLEYIQASLHAEMSQLNALAQRHATYISETLEKNPRDYISPMPVSEDLCD